MNKILSALDYVDDRQLMAISAVIITALIAISVVSVLYINLILLFSAGGYAAWITHAWVSGRVRRYNAEIEREVCKAKIDKFKAENVGKWIFDRHADKIEKTTLRLSNDKCSTLEKQKNIHEKNDITAIDVSTNMDRIILAGATRSGKTFCAKQIAFLKLQEGHIVIALDPKPIRTADMWPDGVRLYGSGDNYSDISMALDFIDKEVSQRAKDFDNIENYPKITIFWDEIADMLYDCPEFQPRYLKILRKYAEYRIDLFIITQSDDYDSCGLPKAQLKRNFRAVLFFEFNEYIGKRRVFYNEKLKMPTTPETAKELPPFTPLNFTNIDCEQRNHNYHAYHGNHKHHCSERHFGSEKGKKWNDDSNDEQENDSILLEYDPCCEKFAQFERPGAKWDFRNSRERKAWEYVRENPKWKSQNKFMKHVFGHSNGQYGRKLKEILRRFDYFENIDNFR